MKFIIIILLSLSSNLLNIYASEPIYITQGVASLEPIAINQFKTTEKGTEKFRELIQEIISNNLKNSSLFQIINSKIFLEKKYGNNHIPDFNSWKSIEANFVVNGEIIFHNENILDVIITVWDVYRQKLIHKEGYRTSFSAYRKVAHLLSNMIYKSITGEDGYFDTKLTYISESGPLKKRIKKLTIMDQDGANTKYLSDGKDLILTPRFSPKSDKILYLSFKEGKPKVYLKDLNTRKDILIGNFPGMSFAPRFSPCGNKALMSIAKDGKTNILEIELNILQVKKLTNHSSINTSPSYSQDGKQIVFNSDRTGSRQLYIMNSDGSDIKRISFGQGSYYSPVWSPRGDFIAFVKITKELGFSIGLMRPDGSGERIVTNGYLVEGPSWSKNGRKIIYTKQHLNYRNKPISKLYMIDITGHHEKEINTKFEASDPDWSK